MNTDAMKISLRLQKFNAQMMKIYGVLGCWLVSFLLCVEGREKLEISRFWVRRYEYINFLCVTVAPSTLLLCICTLFFCILVKLFPSQFFISSFFSGPFFLLPCSSSILFVSFFRWVTTNQFVILFAATALAVYLYCLDFFLSLSRRLDRSMASISLLNPCLSMRVSPSYGILFAFSVSK